MNILVTLNTKNNVNSIFYKYLNYWGKDNNIYMLSKNKQEVLKELYANIKFVDIPRHWNNKLAIWSWYKFSVHPKFDIIIEGLNTVPIFTRKNSKLNVCYYLLNSNYNKILLNIFIRHLNMQGYFIVDKQSHYELLLTAGVIKENILFLEKPLEIDKKIKVIKDTTSQYNYCIFFEKGNSDELKTALEVFYNIARKNDNWKMIVYSTSYSNFEKVFTKYSNFSEIKDLVIYKTATTGNYKIPLNSIIIYTGINRNSLDFIFNISSKGFPFLTFYDGIKLASTPRDPIKMSEAILSYYGSSDKLSKLRSFCILYSQEKSLENLANSSLKFIESI